MQCFCFSHGLLTLLTFLVGIETKPLVLAVLMTRLWASSEMEGTQRELCRIRVRRAWNEALRSPAQVQSQTWGLQIPPYRQWPARRLLPHSPHVPQSEPQGLGTPGGTKEPEARTPCNFPGGTAPNLPRRSRGAPGAAERRLRTAASTWARPQRCAKAPVPGFGPTSRLPPRLPPRPPASGERVPPPLPLCTSPREFAVGDAHP